LRAYKKTPSADHLKYIAFELGIKTEVSLVGRLPTGV
jgi:hypothetical protein